MNDETTTSPNEESLSETPALEHADAASNVTETESTQSRTRLIPTADRPEPADDTKVDPEQFQRARAIGEKMLGTRHGAALLALDALKVVAEQSVEGLLDMLEDVSRDVETFEIGSRAYRLTGFLRITPPQFRAAYPIMTELWDDLSGKGGIETGIQEILSAAMLDERADRLLAYLYVREGQTGYDLSDIDERTADMQHLDLGHRLGAIYRFFTSAVPFAPAVIRGFLSRLATMKLSALLLSNADD